MFKYILYYLNIFEYLFFKFDAGPPGRNQSHAQTTSVHWVLSDTKKSQRCGGGEFFKPLHNFRTVNGFVWICYFYGSYNWCGMRMHRT